jgi:hypothetical protein
LESVGGHNSGLSGERPGKERFDTQNKVQTCLALRFVASCRLRGCDLGKCGNVIQGGNLMQLSSAIRASLLALTVTGAVLTAAYADGGSIQFSVIKAGFVVGGSGGSGMLVFHGRRYPLSIGGVSYGFTFGASANDFFGTVSNIRSPFDVNGVYGAAGAGVAVGPGAGGIVLTNQNGAVLTLSGRQMGLIVAADLNGLVISLR